MPASLEAERMVLGGLMLDPVRLAEMTETLEPEMFYLEAHQRLFRLMLEMGQRHQPTEMVAVMARIMATDKPDLYGGLAYVSGLPDDVPSTENLPYYASLVRDHFTRRRLIVSAQQVADLAYRTDEELPDLLDTAEGQILGITRGATKAPGWEQVSATVRRVVASIREQARVGQESVGLPVGLRALDRMLGGLQGQQLIVLAARPSQGKTALLLCMARFVAEQGVGVGLVSMETSKDILVKRLLAQVSGVPFERIRQARLTKREWRCLERAEAHIARLPIHIDDTPGLTVQQLRANALRLKRDHPEIGFWGTDYIQLMTARSTARNREQVVSESARGLKNLAMEFKDPWMGLSQLNRGVEQRPDKHPMMSDLRESGEIEQAADVILGLYRPVYYDPMSSEKLTAEILVLKQKDGKTGTVKTLFHGPTMLFTDPA